MAIRLAKWTPNSWVAVLIALPFLAASTTSARSMEPPVKAFGCGMDEVLHWRGATVRLENDMPAGTDRNYTNGAALTIASHDLEGPLRVDCLAPPLQLYTRFLAWADPSFWHDAGADAASRNIVVRIGQGMYTPEDGTRTDLVGDDRPYAGLLYAGVAWNRRTRPVPGDQEILDVRELTLGVIGPWSLAEKSQHVVHDIRGVDRFRGWDHQLHNEPALQLAIERKYRRAFDGAVRPGWGRDLIRSHALRVGNIETAASLGVEGRFGWNLPNDFGSYPIRPGAENRPPSSAAALRTLHPSSPSAPRAGLHGFVIVEAKAVAWDFSLDGNLIHDSHRVSREPWVAQTALGISGQWLIGGRGIRLAAMRVWRTREFKEQSGSHAFGSVALSVEL